MSRKHLLVLAPGLADPSRSVRRAAARQVINPRGPRAARIYRRIEASLQDLIRTRRDVLLLPGNGTDSMETLAVNLVRPGDRVLVVVAGAFGGRFADIARVFGADVAEMAVQVGAPVCPDDVRAAVAQAGDIRAVFLTHVETSTGLLLDLAGVAEAVRRQVPGALIVADAMTSAAAHEIEFDRWGLDALVAAGHKSIGAHAGAFFVCLSDRAWAAAGRAGRSAFTRDLVQARDYHRRGQSRFLIPQPAFFSLDAALEEIGTGDGELTAFRERLGRVAETARAILTGAGLRLVTPAAFAARTVTCAWLPPGVPAKRFAHRLATRHKVEIAAGRGELEDRVIRVGHLGRVTEAETRSGMEAVVGLLRTLEPVSARHL